MKRSSNNQSSILQLAQTHPLLRARDVTKLGLPTVVLSRLVAAGQLERVARGVYALPGRSMSEHRALAEVAVRIPRGVGCLLSALQLHGMGTQAPFEVWLALPQGMSAPRLAQPQLRLVRMSGDALTRGVMHIAVDGVQIAGFNPAKTVADCFKFRNKIGLDVALEALRDALKSRKISADELWKYAKINRVTNVMRPYLDAVA